MTSARAMTNHEISGDFAFSDQDFQTIAEMANARYGLFLQPSKKALVYSRLTKRLRALHLPSFDAYCALLNQPAGESEQSHLLSALTTNVTHFFREMHHFEFLRDRLAPDLLAKAKTGQRVRLWSSACSAGQEAYCMAASLLAMSSEFTRHDIKILATDIDPQIIAKARRGIYPADQLDAIPDAWRGTMLGRRKQATGELCMDDDLRKMISFGELNLIADWPMRHAFDVIFCRNAAIYFDKATQSRVWQKFSNILTDGGHLMIGHSERLSGPAEQVFKSVGITTYKRNAPMDGSRSSQQKDK